MAKSKPEPNLRSRWLGEQMRDLRKGQGISQADAADYIQRDPTMLGRYESGEFPFRRVDVLGLLTLYRVDDERRRDGLMRLCEEVWKKDWWDERKDDLGSDFINVPWLDSRADHIMAYQHLVIHGLLQTRRYAEAVITRIDRNRWPADQIQRWVDVRIERQQVFRQDSAPRFSTILEEAVLDRIVGGVEVQEEQLAHLLEMRKRDGLSVKVIQTAHGPHSGLNGSFVLYRMPEPYPTVAHVETSGGSLYLEEPKVNRFLEIWDDLDRSALDPDQSADLIAGRLKGLR